MLSDVYLRKLSPFWTQEHAVFTVHYIHICLFYMLVFLNKLRMMMMMN